MHLFIIFIIIDEKITLIDSQEDIMTKEFEDRGNTYTIHESKDIGEVRVADEVVAIIDGLAATEVKGVKVHVGEQDVVVNLALNIKYGCEIPKVSSAVQDKVKTAIETMTGLNVSEVNIKIAGVNIDN